ncbi:MAG: DUF3097 domain-containing protein [Frankiaceae bacterium]|nr:DUF3097 domain-containing protein [Frankiaceae bacterium]
MPSKDYGPDPIATPLRPRRTIREVDAEIDLVVEDAASGFCGAIVGFDKATVTLEDRFGATRLFRWAAAAFMLDGETVTLRRPVLASPVASSRTASGSIAVPNAAARVAQPSRILVEGVHDCELIERIWGADLRIEGVVVEQLEGADNLLDAVREFRPSADRRLGVLLDHLVTGSKESRIAATVAGPHVMVVGHPFVDIWQAVKPERVGLAAWPVIPKGMPWKEGITAHLGAPDTATAWRRILHAVRSWTDLEPALLGPVEALIDFVTVDGAAG